MPADPGTPSTDSMKGMARAIDDIDSHSSESSSVMTSAIVGLNAEFRHMAGKLGEFVDESRIQHRDIELRLRTLESVIHAVEKIAGLDDRMGSIDARVRMLEDSATHRRGVETAIQVIIGALGGIVGAIVAVFTVLRGIV